MVDAPAVGTVAALYEPLDAAFAVLDDPQIGTLDHDRAVGQTNSGRAAADVVLSERIARFDLAGMGDEEDVDVISRGELLERVRELALGLCFLI